MSIDFTPEQLQIRDSVTRLCDGFGDDYWLERDRDGRFPEAFCQAIADAGFMGIALPEAYGGAGLGITEAALLTQAISESGAGNGGVSSVSIGIFGLNPVVRFGTEELFGRKGYYFADDLLVLEADEVVEAPVPEREVATPPRWIPGG